MQDIKISKSYDITSLQNSSGSLFNETKKKQNYFAFRHLHYYIVVTLITVQSLITNIKKFNTCFHF